MPRRDRELMVARQGVAKTAELLERQDDEIMQLRQLVSQLEGRLAAVQSGTRIEELEKEIDELRRAVGLAYAEPIFVLPPPSLGEEE